MSSFVFFSQGKSYTLACRYLSRLPYTVFSDSTAGSIESDCVFNLVNYLKTFWLGDCDLLMHPWFLPRNRSSTVKVTMNMKSTQWTHYLLNIFDRQHEFWLWWCNKLLVSPSLFRDPKQIHCSPANCHRLNEKVHFLMVNDWCWGESWEYFSPSVSADSSSCLRFMSSSGWSVFRNTESRSAAFSCSRTKGGVSASAAGTCPAPRSTLGKKDLMCESCFTCL